MEASTFLTSSLTGQIVPYAIYVLVLEEFCRFVQSWNYHRTDDETFPADEAPPFRTIYLNSITFLSDILNAIRAILALSTRPIALDREPEVESSCSSSLLKID